MAADAQAYELPVEAAMATHFKRPLAGVAYDWSKCYDRMPLVLLEELADKIGMPAALKGPMLAAYAAPRRVLFMGLASEEVRPTCGLLLQSHSSAA